MAQTIEAKIAEISAQQKAEQWARRQQAAKDQEAEAERKKAERSRTQRIEQIKNFLNNIPASKKFAETYAAEADELAAIWWREIDASATRYATRIHSERQSGRPIRLDLASQEAISYFFSATIKKTLHQLALTANQRSLGAPLPDLEKLREEEDRPRAELAELQLQA